MSCADAIPTVTEYMKAEIEKQKRFGFANLM